MAICFIKEPKIRKRKFGNKIVETEDGKFNSKIEHRRWLVLKKAQADGLIYGLEREVEFSMDIGTDTICKYYADTTYMKDGEFIVEDVKGVRTAVFNLKRKMLRIFYGLEIKIVTKQTVDIPP